MSRFKTIVSLLGATAMAMSLAACGGGSDYCDAIKSAEEEHSGLSLDPETDPAVMEDVVASFRDIADAAPDDVKGDWETVADGMQKFSELDLSDPESIDEGTMQEMEAMQPAFENIATHVQEECDIQMS